MKSYLKVISSMLIWGSLAIFVRRVSYTSAEIVLCRIVLGFIFLFAVFSVSGKRPDRGALKKHLPRLLFSGVIMGLNWLCLFEAYRFVNVSIATLSYYLEPVFVIVGSAVIFKEKITAVKAVCAAAAAAGMFVITTGSLGGADPVRGVVLGLASGMLYAGVTMINKSVKGLSGTEITLIQLAGAFAVMAPYALLTHTGAWHLPTAGEASCILVLGFVHTGIALWMYFSSIQELPAQSIALLSYIDPVSALAFAAVFLGDRLTPRQVLGAILILGGAVIGEVLGKKTCLLRKRKSKQN